MRAAEIAARILVFISQLAAFSHLQHISALDELQRTAPRLTSGACTEDAATAKGALMFNTSR